MIRVLILPYLTASNLPTDLTGKIHVYTQKPKGNRPLGNTNFLWGPGLECRKKSGKESMWVRRRGKEDEGKWGCPVAERHMRRLEITTT